MGNNLYDAILMEMKKVIPNFAEYTLENGVRKYKALPNTVTVQDMHKVVVYLRQVLPSLCAPEDVNLIIRKIEEICLKDSRIRIHDNEKKEESI